MINLQIINTRNNNAEREQRRMRNTIEVCVSERIGYTNYSKSKSMKSTCIIITYMRIKAATIYIEVRTMYPIE